MIDNRGVQGIANALAIRRLGKLLIGNHAVVADFIGVIAGDLLAAVAQQKHRPVAVDGTAIDHAVENAQQVSEHSVAIDEPPAHAHGLPFCSRENAV